MPEKKKLLEVKDLKVVFGSGKKAFTAIDGVSFDIYEGGNLRTGGRVRLRQNHHRPGHYPDQ